MEYRRINKKQANKSSLLSVYYLIPRLIIIIKDKIVNKEPFDTSIIKFEIQYGNREVPLTNY